MVDLDIDKICRVCLQSNIELSLLFDEQNAVDGVCLSDMITECTMYRVKRHDDFPHLICDECMDRVRNAYRFKKQFETSHRKLITFLDSVNKVIVETKPNISVDKCIQTEESTIYPCEKCEEKFVNYESLRDHRLISHKGTANLCRICLKTFNRITDLKNHIAAYHPEMGHMTTNECTICNRRFTRKDHVMRHMRNVHKIGVEAGEELTSKTENDSTENETLIETEIEYESVTAQDASINFVSNYDAGLYEDNVSSEIELEGNNPFSSDEEDEKPLSALQDLKKAQANGIDSYDSDYTVELEPLAKFSLTLESNKYQTPYNANGIKTYKKPKPYQRIENGRYKCIECEKTFSKSSHVRRHFLSHTQEKPFSCTVCGMQFARADHFKRHITRHDEERVFPCDRCDRFYDCLEHLQRHKDQMHKSDVIQIKMESGDSTIQLSQGDPNPTETNCTTSNSDSIAKSPTRKYKCNECDKTFTRSSHVKRHLISHRQEKPFACTVCDKRFGRPDHLKVHLTKHDEERPFSCEMCHRTYGRADLLKRHRENKHNDDLKVAGKTEACEICNKSFSSKSYLQKHLRLHTDKIWKCKLCSHAADSKESLKEHTKSQHKEKPFLCSECGLCFVRNDYLRIHMRRHNGEKPYKCKYCNKGFPRGTDLNVHERYHTGEKTHLCTICGKGFQRAYNLVVHMRVHTGERPYQCPSCPKNFAQGNDLKAHVRRHTGERYKCEVCGAGFIQGYHLTQHKFAVHGIEVESRIGRVTKVERKVSNDIPQNVSSDAEIEAVQVIKLEPSQEFTQI